MVATGNTDLATRFVRGGGDSIRAVYERYGGLVYATTLKVLGDDAMAQDAAQQSFVQAWRAAATFDPSRALGPWLAAIARRVAIDAYRRERRHRNHDGLELADLASPERPPSADQMSDVWEVRQALKRLTAAERELIRLQHYAELTHAEIARHLAIPIGTVKSRSHRAHRRLAGLLIHLRTPSSQVQQRCGVG